MLNNKFQRSFSQFQSHWRPFGPRSSSRQKCSDMEAEAHIWPIFRSRMMVKSSPKSKNRFKNDFPKFQSNWSSVGTISHALTSHVWPKGCFSDMGLQLVFCRIFSNCATPWNFLEPLQLLSQSTNRPRATDHSSLLLPPDNHLEHSIPFRVKVLKANLFQPHTLLQEGEALPQGSAICILNLWNTSLNLRNRSSRGRDWVFMVLPAPTTPIHFYTSCLLWFSHSKNVLAFKVLFAPLASF